MPTANLDTPFGLRPIGRNGTPYVGVLTPYYIPSTYETALYIGDAVVKTSTANAAAVTFPGIGTKGIGSLPEINKVTVGDANAITGVIVGFSILTSFSNTAYNPASTERVAFVCDDPYAFFEIQADGAIPITSVGLNAVLIATHSGSTVTGFSGLELDTTSDAPDTAASNQLTIMRLSDSPTNVPNSIWNKVIVRINNHTEAHGAVGI